jgi:excinuclease ABC subunit B
MRQAMDETSNRRRRQIAFNKENDVTPSSSVRKLMSEQSPGVEPSVHSEEFCENLYELCDLITTKEHSLLAAVDGGDEKQVENIRRQLNRLYRRFIYL